MTPTVTLLNLRRTDVGAQKLRLGFDVRIDLGIGMGLGIRWLMATLNEAGEWVVRMPTDADDKAFVRVPKSWHRAIQAAVGEAMR